MNEVVVAGIGQTAVGEHWSVGLRELALEAIAQAVADAGGPRPQALYVGNMLAPNLSNQAHLGALLADYAGLVGIEAVTVEAAGASGGAALRQGYLAVASGMVDVALVVGVEKITDKIGSGVETALATTFDSDFEAVQGMTPTAQAALLMRRYMHDHEVPSDGFAGFAVTAHANGAGNPRAMFQKPISTKQYAEAEMISEPLNQFDIAPTADGAAAVLLTRPELLGGKRERSMIQVAGSAAAADTLALHDREDLLDFAANRISAEAAMKQAGVGLDQLNLFEYHDSFSVYAAVALEAAGFAERGCGWKLAASGEIGLKGRIPGSTMGGLKARGFPGGATGVYQAVEACLQLRGEAGKNQIQDAACALIQSVGGPGSTSVSHILRTVG